MFILLEDHANIEDSIILKHLSLKDSGAAFHDLKEHEELHDSIDELKNLLNGDSILTNGHSFYLNFSAFHAQYLNHIYHEETQTESSLWQHFTDAELLAMQQEILSRISSEMKQLWWKFMLPAQNLVEISFLKNAVQKNAPEFLPVIEEILNGIDHESYSITGR